MINVFILENQDFGFVWNADDWFKIRTEYRIVGNLIGALSERPRQTKQKGLPFHLCPEEVTLLKEKQFARLVQCPSLLQAPTEELIKAFKEDEERFNASQKEQYLQKKREEVEKRYDEIVAGKRRKNPNFDAEFKGKEALIQEEVDKIQSVSSNNSVFRIHTEDPWIKESDLVDAPWAYPTNEIETLRYEVFKDLWQKNFYLTSGVKFGGDFLCYEGDPLEYHAVFIVVCKKSDEKFPAKDLVSYGRVATSTRKTVVFATRLPAEGGGESEVKYQSLKWVDDREPKPSTSTN